MIESVEKLRESLKDCTSEAGVEPNRFGIYWITASACDMLIDEIEAEITEKYMRLPVDADGVPIHLYDRLLKSTGAEVPTYGEVVGISDDSVFFSAVNRWETNWSNCTRHVNSRTIEDVLTDLVNEVARQGHQIGLTGHELTMRYADEIRELMEVDA